MLIWKDIGFMILYHSYKLVFLKLSSIQGALWKLFFTTISLCNHDYIWRQPKWFYYIYNGWKCVYVHLQMYISFLRVHYERFSLQKIDHTHTITSSLFKEQRFWAFKRCVIYPCTFRVLWDCLRMQLFWYIYSTIR